MRWVRAAPSQEMITAALDFDGVFDLRGCVDAVRRGRMLNPLQLSAVASTLEAAAKVGPWPPSIAGMKALPTVAKDGPNVLF
jgi:hypothetical protein